MADAFAYDLETMEDLASRPSTRHGPPTARRRRCGAASSPTSTASGPRRACPPGSSAGGYRPDVPEWLFELFNPWTTPAALVVAVTAVGWLIGLRGRHLAVLAAVTAAGVGVWQGWKIGPPSGLLDLQIYVGAGRDWLHGTSLYDYHDRVHNLGATYPPIGPIFFALLVPMSAECREILWTAPEPGRAGRRHLVHRRDRRGRAGPQDDLVPVGLRRIGRDPPRLARRCARVRSTSCCGSSSWSMWPPSVAGLAGAASASVWPPR